MSEIDSQNTEILLKFLREWKENVCSEDSSIKPIDVALAAEALANEIRGINNNLNLQILAVALIKASEYIEEMRPESFLSERDHSLTWRLRCSVEAINFIKAKTPEEVTDLLQRAYPPGI